MHKPPEKDTRQRDEKGQPVGPHEFTHHGPIHGDGVVHLGDAAMDAFRRRVRGLPFHEAVHVQPPTPKQLGLEEPEPFEHVSAGFDGDGDGDGDGRFSRAWERLQPPQRGVGGDDERPWYGLTDKPEQEVPPSWGEPLRVPIADYRRSVFRRGLATGFALGVLSTIVAFVLIAGWLG